MNENVQRTIEVLEAHIEWLREHPDFPLETYQVPSTAMLTCIPDTDQFADFVRLLTKGAPLGSVKKAFSSQFVDVTAYKGDIPVMQVTQYRSTVCVKRVVGQEMKKVAKTEYVEELVDVIEWDCGPLLSEVPDAN